MADLLVAPCEYKAAKYAVEKWHYSRVMPAGKTVKWGVWENKQFIGCVIFSMGANNNIGKPYGLQQTETCELTRVALHNHQSPVSKIVAIAIKMLKKQSPGLRLIVSYADPAQDHHGGIYQAMNWVYVGVSDNWKGSHYIININGVQRAMHGRSVRQKWGKEENIPYPYEAADPPPKHKYLYPLDRPTRKVIEALAQPYPKA